MPARGVERWLAQRLSHRLGAGVRARRRRVRARRLPVARRGGRRRASRAPAASAADDDPWHPARAVWPLMEVVDACAGRAVVRTARPPHLGRARSRFAVVAATWPACSPPTRAHRPELLDCLAGRTTTADGARRPALAARAVAAAARRGSARPDPAERLDAAVAALQRDPGARRPAGAAVAVRPHPAARRPARRARRARPAPRRAPVAAAPLPRAVGAHRGRSPPACPRRRDRPDRRAARATRCSARSAATSASCSCAWPLSRHRHPPRRSSRSGRTRRRRRCCGACSATCATTPRPGRPRARRPTTGQSRCTPATARTGRSRCCARCCSGCSPPTRRSSRATSSSMCPDVETFAPLVSAAFGLDDADGDGHPGHRLRGPARRPRAAPGQPAARRRSAGCWSSPTPGSRRPRCSTCSRPVPCGAASASTTTTSTGCATRSRAPGSGGGSTPRTARPYRLDGFPQNTWAAGLDRLLLGVAMAEDELRWSARRCRSTTSSRGDVDLARPARRVGRPARRRRWPACPASGRSPPGSAALVDALDALTATAPADAWQASQARAELADVARGRRPATVPLGLADVRGLLAERLRGRPTRANFRTGSLTVATMVPMRSVPHRVICLLGLDDGAFPRAGVDDGDDVLARDPRVGERDVRSEDRQLLLDAVLRRDRAPGRPLLGRRRADRRPPPARRAAGRAARRRRRHRGPGRAGPRRRPAPAAALRRAQLHRRRARRTRAVQLRPRRAGRVPGRCGREGAAAAVPSRSAAGRRRGDRRARRPRRVRRAPGQGSSCASGSGCPSATSTTSPPTPYPSPSTRCRRWAVGDRLLRDRLAGLDVARCRGSRVAARRAAARRAGHAGARRCARRRRGRWSPRVPVT